MAASGDSNWGPGCDPKRVAKFYFNSTIEDGQSLGRLGHLSAVVAAACATITKAMVAAPTVNDDLLLKVHNVLLAAQHVERLAYGRGEMLELPEEKAGKLKCSPVSQLAQVVADLQERHDKHQLSSVPVDGRAAPGFGQPSTCNNPSNSLPLPQAVLPSIFSHLDPRSAAAAAATCKELRAAYLDHSYHVLPELFTLYVDATTYLAGRDDAFFSGESSSAFVIQWPLDGSATCGADVVKLERKRRTMQLARSLAWMYPEATKLVVPPRCIRPAPSAHTSPLACFHESTAVTVAALATPPPTPSSTPHQPPTTPDPAATIPTTPLVTAAATTAAPDTAGPSTTTSPAAAAPTCSHDALTHACCDVRVLCDVVPGHMLHMDGDLLAVAYAGGWKERDPGLQGCVLHYEDEEEWGTKVDVSYDTGFYSHVRQVCADAAHGLVWAAADGGRRIKAFRAPEPDSGFGRQWGRNRGRVPMALRHTLSTDVKGLVAPHAGLHVLGDSLLAVNACGVLMRWHVSRLQPQAEWRVPKRLPGDDEEESDSDEVDGAAEQEGPERQKEEDDDNETEFKEHIGWRDVSNAKELQASPGEPPHAVHLLQLPVYDMTKRERGKYIKTTAVIADPGSSTPPMLVAALEEQYGYTVLTYDMETLRVRQRLLGHLYEITAIAVPPPSWQGAPLFATASKTGDVKLWDVRSRCCSPAVTLSGGGGDLLEAAVLVAAHGGAGQLGAGMMCFAGGTGEAVWAWDLRAGGAQTLYELSTGNTRVQALAWHQGSSSLLASCESMHYEWQGSKTGEGDGDGDEEEGQAGPGDVVGGGVAVERRCWPKGAKHALRDFKAYWTETESCVVQYRFSDRAGGAVPDCDGLSSDW